MRRFGAFLWLLLLAGCSGGLSGTPPVRTIVGAATASFTITVPAGGAQSRLTRAPQYVSSATQSVIVTLASVNGTSYSGTPASFATNLTTSDPACSGSPITCTIEVSVPIGADVFIVATYDAPQSSSSPTRPAGNVLSQSVLNLNVTSGGPNAAQLVLGGIPASLAMTIAGPVTPAGTNYLAGNMNGLKLWGAIAQQVTLTMLDAAGQTIIGTGAPSLSLTSSSGALSVTNPSANLFVLQAATSGTPAVVTPANLTLTATATLSSGTPLTKTIPLTIAHSAVFVCTGSTGTTVLVFYDGNTVTPSYTIGAANGLNGPRGIAVDGIGTLYVANHGNNTVAEYPAGQTTASLTITSGVSAPEGAAIDRSGNLWIGESGNSTLTEYLPGQSSPSTTITTGLPTIRGVAFDPSGNLWVADQSAHLADQYPAPLGPSSTPTVTITSSLSAPVGIAIDLAGGLWIGDSGVGTAFEFTSPYTGGPAKSLTAGLANPNGVAVDAGGAVWIANTSGNAVVECLPPASNATCSPVISAAGALWVAVVPAAVMP